MAFKEVNSLDADNAIALGGKDKTGKPNPKSIEGFFLGSADKPSTMSKTGLCKLHIFKTAKGNVGVWGKTDLDRKLQAATPGAMTRVTFTGLGEPKPGKKPMYKFKVEQDADNAIEVNAEETSEESSGDYSAENDTENSYEEQFSNDEPEDEGSFDEEEQGMDEQAPQRAAKRATTPVSTSQKKVSEMIANRRKSA